jgi:hypothetical protein
MYCVVCRNHVTEITSIVYKSNSYREVHAELEAYVAQFVRKKQGDIFGSDIKFYQKSVSGKFGKVPYGYIICKGNRSYPKLTVYNKVVVKGIIYDTWTVNKIMSCQIFDYGDDRIELDESDLDEDDQVVVEDEVGNKTSFDKFIFKRKCWTELHSDLIKKIKSNLTLKNKSLEDWEITAEKKEVKK